MFSHLAFIPYANPFKIHEQKYENIFFFLRKNLKKFKKKFFDTILQTSISHNYFMYNIISTVIYGTPAVCAQGRKSVPIFHHVGIPLQRIFR